MPESTALVIRPHDGFQWRIEDEKSHEVLGVQRTKPEALRFAREIISRSSGPATIKLHDIHGRLHAEHKYRMPRPPKERVMGSGGA